MRMDLNVIFRLNRSSQMFIWLKRNAQVIPLAARLALVGIILLLMYSRLAPIVGRPPPLSAALRRPPPP